MMSHIPLSQVERPLEGTVASEVHARMAMKVVMALTLTSFSNVRPSRVKVESVLSEVRSSIQKKKLVDRHRTVY